MNTTVAAAALLFEARTAMQRAVETEIYDTPQRSARRFEILLGLYDDERGEPQTAIIDILTDLLHEADRRGVDIDSALIAARTMHGMELQDWAAARTTDPSQVGTESETGS